MADITLRIPDEIIAKCAEEIRRESQEPPIGTDKQLVARMLVERIEHRVIGKRRRGKQAILDEEIEDYRKSLNIVTVVKS